MSARPEVVRAQLLMGLWALLVSTSFPVGAAITDALDPVALTFLRFVLASTLFGCALALRGGLTRPSARDLLRYGAVAASMVIYFVLMFEALRWTSPVNTGALFTLVPLMSGAVGWLLLRERVPRLQLLFLVIGAVGAAWVVFDGSLSQAVALRLDRGELLFLAGAVAFAFYAPLIKALHRGEPALVMAFWTTVLGAALLGILGAGRILDTDWAAVPPGAFAGIAWLAAGPTAVTFFIAQYSSVRLPPAKTMSYTYLVPALVALLHGATTGDWPTGVVVAGIAVTALATLLLQLSAGRPAGPRAA